MKKRLIIVGAHGSGEIAMSVFEDINKQKQKWDIVGYINDVIPVGNYLGKYKVVGDSNSIIDFINQECHIHYTYHFSVKNKIQRVEVLKELDIPLEAHATGIHPLAYQNPYSKIGRGSLMLPYSSTSAGAIIGDFCHLYTNSFLGHDSNLGNYSTMAAHSILGARVKIGEGSHIGLNSCTRENVSIGKYSIVGMGATVISDMKDNDVFVGNPARKI
jgi:sugar O-acyltransferase (sialic acid O-acetyltransferase NeuD family)